MAVDILGLGYKVDTGDIKRAERDLDKFASANKKAAGNVDDLSSQSDKAARTTSSLARSLGTLAAAFITLQAASSLVRIADEYTKFTAQLRLATDSVSQFQAAYGEVVSIARSSQSDIGGLGTLYARITNATREMGLAQGDVAKISETVALSLRVSGATAAESASAMLQLSQAFGSGVLRGEEFNAVNEAAPGLLRALAESIGVPVGALREMASNGELTADVLARAFKDEELLAKLREQAKEVQTVGSAITALKTELTLFVGEVDKTTGASKALAQAIGEIAEFIGENQEGIMTFFGTLSSGAVIGGLGLAAANIGKITLAIEAMTIASIAAAKNPVVLAILGLGSLAAAAAYAEQQTANIEKTLTAQTKIAELSAKIAASEKFIADTQKTGGNRLAGLAEQRKLNDLYAEYNDLILQNSDLEKDYQAEWNKGKTEQTALQKTFANAEYEAIMATFEAQEKANKDNTKSTKDLGDERKRLTEALGKNLQKATEDYIKSQQDLVNKEEKTTEEIQKQVEAIRKQIAEFGKSGEELRALERGNLDFTESVIKMRIAMAESGMASRALIPEYEAQLQAIKDLKAEQDQLYKLEDDDKYRQAAEALMAANKDIADTFQDDLLNSIKTAFLQGGKFSEAFARGLKAELIEAFLDPALGNAINQAKSGNFAGIAGIASAGSVGGGSGAALSALLQNANGIASKLVSISGSTGNTAASMLQLGNNLSKIAPYAGSIAALIQGDVKGAAGSALGTYIGGAIAGPIGAAIGATLGGLLGGSKKISATSLSPEFGQNVTKALADQYAATAAALGGAAAGVVFGAGGNTGRQGQNPNFTLGASFGGRNIFNSNQTREGQADGLFLSGEIALNEANLADQSLRALVAALQQTDFADNIDEVVDSVNAASGSFADLEAAIAAAQLLNVVNGFKDMEGAIRTLSGASAETVGKFFELVGGLDGLNQGMAAFYEAFTSEQQKAADLLESVTTTFINLGRPLPQTRDELNLLINSLDLRNEADQRVYATILALVPALDELLPAFESIADAVDLTGEATDRFLAGFSTLRQAISDAEADLREAFNRESSELNGLISSFDALENSLKQFRISIRATVEDISLGSLQAARRRFASSSGADVIGAGNELAQASLQFSASRADYIKELSVIQARAAIEEAKASSQKTVAQMQLDALTLQVGELIELNDSTLLVKDAVDVLRELQTFENAAIENAIENGLGGLIQSNGDIRTAVERGTDASLSINQAIAQLVGIEAERAAKEQAEAAAAEAERQRIVRLADINNQAQAVQSSLAQGQSLRTETTGDLSTLQQQAYNLARQFGVFINEKAGPVQLANTAKFGVNESTGLFQQAFGQISIESGGNAQGFKNAFYAPGGIFNQIQAEAAQLAAAKNLIDPANQQLAALRAQILELGGIPEFAKGGIYKGGMALVGEQGPELINFNQGGRVSSNQDTVLMMQKANDELVAEMKEMRKQIAMLITTSQQTAVNTGKASRIWDDVTQNGTAVRTTEVPA